MTPDDLSAPRPKFALGQRCEHGQLARSCDTCDKDRDIEHLRGLVAQYKADAERFRAIERDFSVMSLDIDGNHYWVWRGRGYRGANLREAIDKARKSAAVDHSSPGG